MVFKSTELYRFSVKENLALLATEQNMQKLSPNRSLDLIIPEFVES